MEVILVTDYLFDTTYNTQSVISCFQMLWDCFLFFLEIFILTPLNWIIQKKNYAISDSHPIFFQRDQLDIGDSMTETINPEN